MIKSIHISKVATYSVEGVKIEDLKPISFIYGANGSGKTTISNSIANPEEPKFKDCSIEWSDGQRVTTYVYNKDFREQNFFKGDIPGVFTLGKASVDQMKALDEKKEALKNLRATALDEKRRLKGYEDQIADETDRFKETVWNTFKKPFDSEFSDAFKGCGYKETFKKRLLDEFKNNSADLKSKEDLIKNAKTIFGGRPQEIEKLKSFDVERLKEIEELDVWDTPILGKTDVPIADMITKLGNSDWVDKGQEFIKDNTCPFCQEETITNDFKKNLEDFFDQSYKEKLKEVEGLREEYYQLTELILADIDLLRQREKADGDTKLDWDNLETEIELLQSRFLETKRIIEDKLKEPSRKFTVTVLNDLYDHFNKQIKDANHTIEAHNKVVSNFNSSHALLVRSVWKFIIEEARPTIQAHMNAVNGITAGKAKLIATQKETTAKGIQLKKDIEELAAGTSGVEFSELEMNKTLESYGFNSFKIVRSPENDKCYQIQREDGSLVKSTLSEGEITFITFLYFYQLAKGGHSEESINDQRVLVVDDPISSLDSNVLFVVSSLLRKYIEEIRNESGNIVQLILLTHNSYFHKQMAIINGKDEKRTNTAFWILRKGKKWTTIEFHGMSNPISSTYELLWRELRTEQKKSSVMLQNAMRRILEYYFTVFGQFTNIKNLEDKFDTVEEKLICKSLLSWVNDGSHDIADELHVSDYDGTEERYKNVFRDLFVANHQLGHYNQMMGINEEVEDSTLV